MNPDKQESFAVFSLFSISKVVEYGYLVGRGEGTMQLTGGHSKDEDIGSLLMSDQ